MSLCGAPHPETGQGCILSVGNHPQHQAGFGKARTFWDSDSYVPPEPKESRAQQAESRKRTEKLFLEASKQMTPETSALDGPIVRHDDPESAHLAAERIEPKRGTRAFKVLEHLRSVRGEWVDGFDLATEEIGGSEGLRRLRELRKAGWDIEERPHPTNDTAWQYRMAPPVVPRNFD